MANTLDPMDIKQIISLHIDGFSNRKIGTTLSISRNTVNNYIHLFQSSSYSFRELLDLDVGTLESLFPSTTTIDNARYAALMSFFDATKTASNHPGFTLLFHYQDYFKKVDNPYSYTQFTEHYRRKYKKIKGSMKLEHQPGNEMYIDYAGKKLEIIDKETGELVPVEVFVAILPNSQYTYVEASRSQKKEDFIKSCENALHYYGGVPKAIVSDNLKAAVTKANKYEAQVNRSFKEFARHYNCVINPARGYSPQDKALVENAVHLVYQRIYYPLRDMQFFSLEDLNKEIHRLLKKYNDLLFKRKQASRLELFQSIEREHLKPLVSSKFEMTHYKRAKVQKIGYVYFSPDKTYYSVPYRYIGKHTCIHYTQSVVEVYYNHKRIAYHTRNPTTGTYTTKKEHLSSVHQQYSEWSIDYFVEKASKHGDYVVKAVRQIITELEYPEIGYKRAMGLIQKHKAYGSERLNNACEIAIQADIVSYKAIKNILKNNTDKGSLFFEILNQEKTHIPNHENIRGANYYT